MVKRVLVFAAVAAIFVAAVIASLVVLDIITAPELRETLRKTLSVIGLITAAIVLSIGAAHFLTAARKSSVKPPAAYPPA
jgi:hypothetical protein